MKSSDRDLVLNAMNNLIPLMAYPLMSEEVAKTDPKQAYTEAQAELIGTLGIDANPALRVVVAEKGKETVTYEIPAKSLPNLPVNFPQSFDFTTQEVSIELPYGMNQNATFDKREARRLADALGENMKINKQGVTLEDFSNKIRSVGNQSIINLAAFNKDKIQGKLVKDKKSVGYDIMPPPSESRGANKTSLPSAPPPSMQSVPPPSSPPPAGSYTLPRPSAKTPPPPPPGEPPPEARKHTARVSHPDHVAEVLRERAEPKDPYSRSK